MNVEKLQFSLNFTALQYLLTNFDLKWKKLADFDTQSILLWRNKLDSNNEITNPIQLKVNYDMMNFDERSTLNLIAKAYSLVLISFVSLCFTLQMEVNVAALQGDLFIQTKVKENLPPFASNIEFFYFWGERDPTVNV